MKKCLIESDSDSDSYSDNENNNIVNKKKFMKLVNLIILYVI